MRSRCPLVLTLCLAVYAAGGVTASPVLAAAKQSSGPTTRAPHNLLRVNLVERTGKLRDEASQLDQSIRKALDQISAAGDPGYRNFEATYGALLRYTRIATELTVMGEPTGEDMGLRQQNYRKTLFEHGKKYAEGKSAKRAVDKRLTGLPRLISKTASKISKASKNAEKKKWRLAYDGLNEATYPVQEVGFWHEIVKGSTHPTIRSWQQTSAAWFYHLSKELREEAKRICLDVTEKHQNGTKLIESIQKFSAALTSAATADPGTGSNLSGPQAVEYFGNLWIEQQRNAMRARGHAAFLEYLRSRGASEPVIAEHDDFSTKIGPALAKLIQADAQRASAEEAPAVYMQYLERIPPLVARGNTAALVELFQPQLDQLAARSAELQEEIQRYTASTADLLRWRRRTVQAYVRAQAESYPSLESVVNENCKDRKERSLLVREPDGHIRALLAKSIPELIEEARAGFMDKAVSVLDLRYRDNYVIGITDVRSIAYVPTSAGVTKSAVDNLANDLFAASGSEPMSLAAAVALYMSETGDCSAAGGEIYHIGLTTVAARYTSQTEDDRGLVRLGAFRTEPKAWKTEDLTLMFALKPSWFAHEYFFVQLPE